MKYLMRFLSVVTLILFCINQLHGQWIQANQPMGGDASSLAVSGSNIFARTDDGNFFSTNNGTNWIKANNELADVYVDTFTGSGSNLFAYSVNRRIMRSTDNGMNWTLTNLTDTSGIGALCFSGTKLIAATYENLYISTDYGASWVQKKPGWSNGWISTLAIIGDSNFFAVTQDSGIYRSTDNGTSWRQVNYGLTNIKFLSLAVSPNMNGGWNLFAGSMGGGIFLSTNNGDSWAEASPNISNLFVTAFYVDTSSQNPVVFAGGWGNNISGIYRTSDNGANWAKISNGLNNYTVSSIVIFIDKTGSKNIFTGTYGGGVFRWNEERSSWVQVNTGLKNADVCALAISDSNIYAGTGIPQGNNAVLGSGVFHSTDYGSNWAPVNEGLLNTNIYSLIYYGSNIFAGAGFFARYPASEAVAGVYLSANNGAGWVQKGLSTHNVYNLIISGNTLYAATETGVFLSSDFDTTWTETTGAWPLSSYISSLAALTLNGGTVLYCGNYNFGVYKSTNNGKNWTQCNTGLTKPNVLSLTVYTNRSGGSTLFAGTDLGGVFISTNYGSSWTQSGLSGNSVYAFAAAPNGVNGINLFAGTSAGVFLSLDNGVSWTAVDSGLTDQIVYSLGISGDYLFAGTNDAGVWRRSISEMAALVKNLPLSRSMGFVLEQNYPNPFSAGGGSAAGVYPSTIISYQLPMNSFVTLKVYDALGKEVKMLVDEQQDEGYYSINFHAGSLPSGVYYYRIHAGSFVETKKLILVK